MFPDLSRCIVIAMMSALFVPLPLLADEFRLTPGVALKEEFNDNIFLATNVRRTDFISTITPSVDLVRASELQNASLAAGINFLNYNRYSSLNASDYYGQGGFNYQFDPRLAISAGAGYVQDSRPDRTDQGGLALKSGSTRQNYQLSGNYGVSEKSTATLSYAYSHEDYEDPRLLATTVHTVSYGQDYKLDNDLRQARLVGNLGYSRDLTATSLVDNYTVSMGLSKKIHELWSVSLNVGGRFTHSEFDVATQVSATRIVTSRLQSDNQGGIGNLSISYSDETTNGSVAFNHDVTTASGRSGTTQRTGVSASLTERFGRKLSGVVSTGYSWNRSAQNQYAAQSIDEKNLTINSGLRYDFSEFVSLEGNYRFNVIFYDTTSTQAVQNAFMLRLSLRRDVLDL